MLVHFPNSTVEVGESRGLTGLDRNTLQSKLKLFVFWLLSKIKIQNLCFFAEVGDSHESETEKCEKESDRYSDYASKTLRQCQSLYKTQCKINLTFQSPKPLNFEVDVRNEQKWPQNGSLNRDLLNFL